MELLQLQYFCDAASSENFSATAKKYMVPPSAVSQSIKRLESELGTRLFVRSANRVQLSPKGRIFYEKVRQGLHMIAQARAVVCGEEERETLRLSIFINRRTVMQTVEKFSHRFPQVDIVTKYITQPGREEFDLIINDTPPEQGEYTAMELVDEDILLAVNAAHPLASVKHISAQQLSATPFICTNKGSSLYRITDRICRELGFSPRIVIFSDDPYYIRKCVELGLGVCFIPAVSWQGELSGNVVARRVGEHSRVTYAYCDSSKPLSKHAALFLEMLREEFAAQVGSGS